MSEKEPLDLEPIKERLSKATPGPWKKGEWFGRCHKNHQHSGREGADPCVYDYTITEGVSIILPERKPITLLHNYSDWGQILDNRDVEFVANAPTDIAALIAEVERLRGNSLC